MDASRIEVVTFDCYNTLVDARGGGSIYLYNLARKNGDETADPGWKLRDRWEAIQFDLLHGDFIPYREVLHRSIRAWVDERGYTWDDQIAEDVVGLMSAYQPFPDTRPALQQVLDAGKKLVIISNVDRDIIAHTARQIDLRFHDIITSEDAGAYKPSDQVFDYAKQRLGVPDEQVLHVAFGFKYDLAAATRAGWSTAWINRHNEPKPDGPNPDVIWRDLWGLARFVGGSGPWFE
jgi:2-haloacid dehalogenase